MVGQLKNLLERFQSATYARRQPLVLINGLAEQAESWFRNAPFWRRYYDVYMPNTLVYDGAALHRRIEARQPISVDYLVEELHQFLEQFVQTPPYHLVAASLGGKIAVEYAIRYPQMVSLYCATLPIWHGRRGTPAHRRRRPPQRSAFAGGKRVLQSAPRRSEIAHLLSAAVRQ